MPLCFTTSEYEKIKGHTTVGDQILRSIKQSPTLRIGAHYHHERYDGSGYPEGLAGEDIPKIARIVAGILPGTCAPVPAPDFGRADGLLPVLQRSTIQMEVSAPQFLIGVKLAPGARGEDALRERLTASLAMRMLCGPSSPFFARNYEQGLLNMDFDFDVDACAGTVTVMIGGESRDPEAVLAAYREECARIAAEGFDPGLFERSKRAALGGSLRSLEDFDTVCVSLAGGVFEGFCSLDSFRLLEGVTVEDCRRFVQENLTSERMAMAVIEPKKG